MSVIYTTTCNKSLNKDILTIFKNNNYIVFPPMRRFASAVLFLWLNIILVLCWLYICML